MRVYVVVMALLMLALVAVLSAQPPGRETFEYKAVFAYNDPQDIERMLNPQGAEGWELVTVSPGNPPSSGRSCYVLKREVRH